MKEEILKLRSEGKTYNEIKEILGCSKGTISYHCGFGQKEKSKDYNRNRRVRNRNYVQQIKSEMKCNTCGENRHWVLDFHHLDPSVKDGNISYMVASMGKEKVLEEIEKCIVLCANCHRDLHYREQNL